VAIAFVQVVGTNSTKSFSSSLAVTVPAGGVPIGHTLFFMVAMQDQGALPTLSDSKVNTWVRDEASGIFGTDLDVHLFRCHVTVALVSGDTISIAGVTAGNNLAISLLEFSGLDTSSVHDKVTESGAASGLGTAWSSGATGTTTQANELLIGFLGTQGPIDDGIPTGISDGQGHTPTAQGRVGTTGGSATTNYTVNPYYQIVSATASYTLSGTMATARNNWEILATYKAAAAGLSPPPFQRRLRTITQRKVA
jgi:hypothetical protein